MKDLLARRIVLIVVAALATGIVSAFIAPAAHAQDGVWSCDNGNLIVVGGPMTVAASSNYYRVDGTGPGLPTAGVPVEYYLTWELSGPGTWSDLTLQWMRTGLPWSPSENPLNVEGCERITPVAGCDMWVNIPEWAVGATLLSDTRIYWQPGHVTEHSFTAGTNVRAVGLDPSGEYYQVIFQCDYLWVPAGTLGPNYEAPWNGAPLPTVVVEPTTPSASGE